MAAAGAFLLAQVFFFTPFVLYGGNPSAFSAPLGAMLAFFWRPAVVGILLLGLVGFLVPARLATAFRLLLLAVGVAAWVQGNLLVGDYGPMDGNAIDWNAYAWRGWVDLALWVSCVGLVVGFARRLEAPLARLAVCLFVLQALSTAYFAVQKPRLFTGEGRDERATTDVSPFRAYSAQRNVLHIVADGFQGDVFDEVVNDVAVGPRFRSALDGFVHFRDNLGSFSATHFAVPSILGARSYRNDVPIPAFMRETIGGRNILADAKAAGFEIEVATPGGVLAHLYSQAPIDRRLTVDGHWHVRSISLDAADAARLLDLSLFRLAPQAAKRLLIDDQRWFIQRLAMPGASGGLDFFAGRAFLGAISTDLDANRAAPVYRMIHLLLSHAPMVAEPHCGYAGAALPYSRQAVKVHVFCALNDLTTLFDAMKRAGVYDQTTIVVMGDHGSWVPRATTWPTMAVGEDMMEAPTAILLAAATPLMLVKRPGEHGELRTSDVPSSIQDAARTIAASAGFHTDLPGQDLFELPDDPGRPRAFHYYNYSASEYAAEHVGPIQEYLVTGPALDPASWRKGKRYEAAAPTEVSAPH